MTNSGRAVLVLLFLQGALLIICVQKHVVITDLPYERVDDDESPDVVEG